MHIKSIPIKGVTSTS